MELPAEQVAVAVQGLLLALVAQEAVEKSGSTAGNRQSCILNMSSILFARCDLARLIPQS